VARCTEVLGADAPVTLGARRLRARLLPSLRRYADASRAYGEVAADAARTLGPDHPDVLDDRYWEAHWLHSVRPSESARLFAPWPPTAPASWAPRTS
jgi:hypothetical protein